MQLSAFCDTAYHAAFAIKGVVHIYAKPICCNEKITPCHHRTGVFVNVFDVHFSSFLFYTLSTCKSKFVSLEETCKTRARKTRCSRRANKLLCAARISPFSRKQTACYLSQNIRFNGSRKMRVSCLEARVSSLEMRLLSCEKRDEGW